MKILWLDTETGGLDSQRHALLQVAAIAEVDGVVRGELNLKLRPADGKIVDEAALVVQGIDRKELSDPDRHDVYEGMKLFQDFLSQFVDKFDREDKFFLVGYNIRFDEEFIRQWFTDCVDRYYGSWFWSPSIDVMAISAAVLLNSRPGMTNFKLGTVADTLMVEPDGSLHDALSDIRLTRKVLYRVAPWFGR